MGQCMCWCGERLWRDRIWFRVAPCTDFRLCERSKTPFQSLCQWHTVQGGQAYLLANEIRFPTTDPAAVRQHLSWSTTKDRSCRVDLDGGLDDFRRAESTVLDCPASTISLLNKKNKSFKIGEIINSSPETVCIDCASHSTWPARYHPCCRHRCTPFVCSSFHDFGWRLPLTNWARKLSLNC